MLIQRNLNLFAYFGDLLETHGVDLFRRNPHGDKTPHQRGVAGLAIWVAGDRQRLAGFAQVLVLDEVGEAIQRGCNLLVINLFGGLAKGSIVAA